MREKIFRRSKLCAALLTLASSQASFADLVTFDELDASAGDIPLSDVNPYHTLTWTNFSAYTSLPGFDGFNNGIVSGANAAYSGGELAGDAITPVVGSISSARLFDFQSAALGAGWYDNLSLTIQGWRAGAALYSQTLNLNTNGSQFFAFDFIGIDTLTFVTAASVATLDPFLCGSFNCTQFALDNLLFEFTADGGPPANVPEPGSAMLLLAGLLGFVPFLRRRPIR